MVSMAHAIRVHSTGGPDELQYERVPELQPGHGEVLLRQTAIGVNFIDVYYRTGLYPLPSLPHVLGGESVGVVIGIGDGVDGICIGDRIGCVSSSPPGAYAEQRVIPAAKAIPIPSHIDDATAAAAMLKGLTAEFLARRITPLQRGQRALVHAAAGGVGSLLCQWLHHLGVEVIGTVSTEAKAELAQRNGCTHTIVYTADDFVARVRDLTVGNGVDIVYDSVGKTTAQGSLDCLRRRGTLVLFGNSSGKPDPIDPMALAKRGSLFVTRPSLHDYVHDREELLAASAALWDVVQSGAVRIHIDRELPLRDAAAAHRALESRSTTGSIVLIP